MSKHEWVNSTLGHGANMCRHCLMTDAEAAALGCLDTCDAERTPTDAEIEAMAEKLWDVWNLAGMAGEFTGPDWAVMKQEEAQSEDFELIVYTFRAMARVALEGMGE